MLFTRKKKRCRADCSTATPVKPSAIGASQTVLDEKRALPFHHALLRGLSYFWPLAVLPAIAVAFKTGSPVAAVGAAFAANSLLTILFYWEDKHLARYKYWRIPEKCLHVWEFLCGWPGALYAQHAFRHKRCKGRFMVVFWLCAAANVALMLLLLFHRTPIMEALESWRQKCTSFFN